MAKRKLSFVALRAERRKLWGRDGSLRAQLQQRFPSGTEVGRHSHTHVKNARKHSVDATHQVRFSRHQR